MEGFFYKRRWVSERKRYWMPIVIATSIKPVVWDKNEMDLRVIVWIALVGSVFLVALFVYLIYRNRQEREAFERRHRERMDDRDRTVARRRT